MYKNLGRNGQNLQSVQLGQSGKNLTNYFWIYFPCNFCQLYIEACKVGKMRSNEFFLSHEKNF